MPDKIIDGPCEYGGYAYSTAPAAPNTAGSGTGSHRLPSNPLFRMPQLGAAPRGNPSSIGDRSVPAPFQPYGKSFAHAIQPSAAQPAACYPTRPVHIAPQLVTPERADELRALVKRAYPSDPELWGTSVDAVLRDIWSGRCRGVFEQKLDNGELALAFLKVGINGTWDVFVGVRPDGQSGTLGLRSRDDSGTNGDFTLTFAPKEAVGAVAPTPIEVTAAHMQTATPAAGPQPVTPERAAAIHGFLANTLIKADLRSADASWRAVLPFVLAEIKSGTYGQVFEDVVSTLELRVGIAQIMMGQKTYNVTMGFLPEGQTSLLQITCLDDQRPLICPVSWAHTLPSSTNKPPPQLPEFSSFAVDSWQRRHACALMTALRSDVAPSATLATSEGAVERMFTGIEAEDHEWTVMTRTLGTGAVEMKAHTKTARIACQVSAVDWITEWTQHARRTKGAPPEPSSANNWKPAAFSSSTDNSAHAEQSVKRVEAESSAIAPAPSAVEIGYRELDAELSGLEPSDQLKIIFELYETHLKHKAAYVYISRARNMFIAWIQKEGTKAPKPYQYLRRHTAKQLATITEPFLRSYPVHDIHQPLVAFKKALTMEAERRGNQKKAQTAEPVAPTHAPGPNPQ